MLKFDKIEVSGLIVLLTGVVLLAFTFFSACTFLNGNLTVLVSVDLTQLFGNALAPLIEAVIRILYLGIMGWIGSILTMRGIQLLKREKELVPSQPLVKAETKKFEPPAATAPIAAAAVTVEQRSAVKESKKTEGQELTQVQEQPEGSEKEAQKKWSLETTSLH